MANSMLTGSRKRAGSGVRATKLRVNRAGFPLTFGEGDEGMKCLGWVIDAFEEQCGWNFSQTKFVGKTFFIVS